MARWQLKDVQLKLGQKIDSKPIVKKRRNKKGESPANALTKETIRILRLLGYNVWRQNSAGIFDPVLKVYRRNSATKGVADVIGYHRHDNARFIAAEIKIPPDKLSIEQENFLRSIREAGGIAIVVRSAEDLERFYKEHSK